MRPIKQKPDSSDCVAATAAMVAGTNIGAFHRKLGISNGYYDDQFFGYLRHYSFFPGLKIDKKFTIGRLRESGIMKYPALITVKSEEEKGELHAVYWSGKKAYDPSPKVKNGRSLESYKILYWCPIYKI